MTKPIFFKWLKRVVLVVAIIPILMFLGFAGAVNLIDFNQYKPQIEKEVAQLTGRDFKIDGSVDLSVLPFVFNIGKMSLKNPAGFTEENLLTVREAQIELSLAALFIDKEVSIVSLEVIEPKLHLIKTATGDNWTDIKALAQWLPTTGITQWAALGEMRSKPLVQPQSATEWFASLESTKVSYPLDTENKNASSKIAWAFDSLLVRNGEITFVDQPQNYTATLSKINILTFDVVKDQPFDVSSDFVYQHSLSQGTYDAHLNSTLEIKQQFKEWVLSDWSGVFKFHLPEEQKVPEIRLTTVGKRLAFNFETRQIDVVKAHFKGLEASLLASFSGTLGRPPVLSGALEAHNLDFKHWAYRLGFKLPKLVDHKALREGKAPFEWQWDGQTLFLQPKE